MCGCVFERCVGCLSTHRSALSLVVVSTLSPGDELELTPKSMELMFAPMKLVHFAKRGIILNL